MSNDAPKPLTTDSPNYPPNKFCYLSWDSKYNETRAFCNTLIFMDLHALKPTIGTIGSIFGVEMKDWSSLYLVHKDHPNKIVQATAAQDSKLTTLLNLNPGEKYFVRLSEANQDARLRVNEMIKIEQLLANIGDGEETVYQISKKFYNLVFNDTEHNEFRKLFLRRGSTEEVAVQNQYEWFVELFGGTNGPKPYTKRFFPDMETADATGRTAVGRVIALHTDDILIEKYALPWLTFMGQAIDSIQNLKPRVKRTLKLYMLHFLAFFDIPRMNLAVAIEGGKLDDHNKQMMGNSRKAML